MKMIVGLGNPGAKYTGTKHNIGFITMDELAFQEGLTFNKSKFEAVYAEAFIGTEKVILVKPQTFMNDSGRSVRPLMDYFNLGIDDLVVVYDDLDLPTGKIRLRQKGSAGGHNGIKSLIQHLGTSEFNRIRIGIDRPVKGQTVINHVLSNFPKEVHEEMLFAVKDSAKAIRYWVKGHTFLETMNEFNKKA
ncbi:aminoacyl-tRNA hydrolase [Carnobacterium divergens]|uniref:Peptidyl-tRNA hydrolase n=1 Tax=Carnobacterium divergens TaxID=2748 RepID=A0A7Z8G510_CARDV|nr:aminoacyl-tRNA hydrolase [Carnobacterium divergens]TFI71811.1 aminoacyl-tRNA hydrolase [Carnobacterium divergens]TFI76660.1 aminoacyl-tRNA hydrolase [Carnobacterium divergens]TFI82488.1 aminoacyl-tRNA hydrolase [Carnobacterium divergens]TFI94660.1 aminoacyl-tRNA hydrolase [Carnobacterium divergens]TFJ11179.1 aminoacyl-tRNA hydrolase [Carnobacterium divergens]